MTELLSSTFAFLKSDEQVNCQTLDFPGINEVDTHLTFTKSDVEYPNCFQIVNEGKCDLLADKPRIRETIEKMASTSLEQEKWAYDMMQRFSKDQSAKEL